MNDTIRACLEHVRKPARYTGGEYNAVYKDKSQVDLRFAFCFPDIYEIGMSHLGSKILYGLLNSMEASGANGPMRPFWTWKSRCGCAASHCTRWKAAIR